MRPPFFSRTSWSSELNEYLVSSSRSYRDNLLGKSLLIIYAERDAAAFLEVRFDDENWAHLAGVSPYPSINARTLFAKACGGVVTGQDVVFPLNEGVLEKAAVFTSFSNLARNVSSVSTFNGKARLFTTDRLLSNPKLELCVGIVEDETSATTYVANSLMKRDRQAIAQISEEGEMLKPVLAVFSKLPGQRKYSHCEQVRNKITTSRLKSMSAVLNTLVDREHITEARQGLASQLWPDSRHVDSTAATLDGAKAAQKNRPKVEQTGSGSKQ